MKRREIRTSVWPAPALLALLVLLFGLSACGGRTASDDSLDSAAPVETLQDSQDSNAADSATLAIPADRVKPWETVDAAGAVIPATDSAWLRSGSGPEGRAVSGINSASEFVAGGQFDSVDGAVSLSGLAASFEAPASGRCVAFYRLPLQGVQPGAASIDVNLRLNTVSGELSQCWVGVAEWGKKAWEWRLAPEGHTRFSLAGRVAQGADFINDLGNLQIAVVGYDGASFDLVGIGVNTLASADSSAPPVPSGLSATPVAGGLELQWVPVIAADLAGYRVYYSNSTFSSTGGNVRQVPYLQGSNRHLLAPRSGTTVVRITAVDISGNESALSDIAAATPLAGTQPTLEVTTSLASGTFGEAATLSASGAALYDIDADGDGIYEISASASGTAAIDTNQTGIIRPAVRASNGTAVAHGSVSLIIAANLPPVAVLDASSNTVHLWGDGPVSVNLDASGSSDEDAGSLQFAFDGDGNGSFSSNQAADSLSFDYVERGSYLAAVKVTDSAGLVGYASSLVDAKFFSGFGMAFIATTGSIQQVNGALVTGIPSAVYFESNSGNLFYSRARDSEGRLWRDPFAIDLTPSAGQFPSLAEIAGRPAVAYYDSLSNSLKYIRCTSSSGSLQSSWSSPPVVVAPMTSITTNSIVLLDVGGRPAIVYGRSSDDKIMYIRATGTGESAAHWLATPVEIDSGASSAHVSLALVDGNPAMAYYKNSDIFYKRATSSGGDLASDWNAVPFSIIGTEDAIADTPSLCVVDGNPAVSFINPMNSTRVYYVRATNSTGATQADWAAPVLMPQISSPFFTDLALVDGKPAVITFGSLMGPTLPLFCRSRDAQGATWERFLPSYFVPSLSFNFFQPQLIAGGDVPGIITSITGGSAVYLYANFE